MLRMVSRADWLLLPAEVGDVWGGLLRTHKVVTSAMGEELERVHGLDLTGYDVLRQLALADRSRLRMGELAQRVMLTRSGLSGAVDRLEAASLVVREPTGDDGRGVYARITPQGMRLLRRTTSTIEKAVRRHFIDHLTVDDLAALRAIWEKLGTASPPFALPLAAEPAPPNRPAAS
jgi:DNA-binding MarR family transcriptional regulator